MTDPDLSRLLQRADFDASTLSPEALRKLIRAYCRLYQVLDGLWYLAVQEKYGDPEALDRDIYVWERVPKFETKALAKLLGVEGKTDLASFLKLFLLTPINVLADFRFDTLTEDECVLVITRCPILHELEREGKGREKDICQRVDPIIFRSYARYFNPRVEITPLKLPPRQTPDELPCRWQIRLGKSEAGATS